MRIAIFTETYLPAVNGVVTHIKTLKEGLEALGHQVVIVAADSHYKKHTLSDGVIYCPALKLKKIYNYDAALPYSFDRLKLIKEFNPDIIHIHNEFGVGFSGLMIAKKLKIPCVYTLHTMYDDYVYYVANKHFCKFVTAASHKYAKFLGNKASAITGPSKKVEEYFKNCGVKKPVSVIPNSVETERFRRDAADPAKVKEIRESFGFADDDFVLCFCGRMGQEKNIGALLDYWKDEVKHDDRLKLMLIGGGPLLEENEEMAKTLGIDDMVKFTGRVDHSEIVPYYAVGDAYITASLTECYSISMLEGMSMGMPVLTLRDELNADQIKEGVNGYNYRDEKEMYRYICMMRDMSAEDFERFRASTRQSVVDSSSTTLANYILPIYETVIDEYKQKMLKRKSHKKSVAAKPVKNKVVPKKMPKAKAKVKPASAKKKVK